MELGFEPHGSAPHQRSAALPCCPGLWKVTSPAHRTCRDMGLHRLSLHLLACPLPVSALCCNTRKLVGFVARSLPQSWRWVASSALWALPPSRPKMATSVGPGTFLKNPRLRGGARDQQCPPLPQALIADTESTPSPAKWTRGPAALPLQAGAELAPVF